MDSRLVARSENVLSKNFKDRSHVHSSHEEVIIVYLHSPYIAVCREIFEQGIGVYEKSGPPSAQGRRVEYGAGKPRITYDHLP